jgi:mono/diheme cytochrome c family protein
VLKISRRKQQRNLCLVAHHFMQLAKRRHGFSPAEFANVSLSELRPLRRARMVPAAKLMRRRNVRQPGVRTGSLLRKAAWPQAIDKNSKAVGGFRGFVDPLEHNLHGLILTESRNNRIYLLETLVMWKWNFVLASSLGLLLVGAGIGCQDDSRQKTDAELGLTAQQASGRRVYEAHCQRCHEPYSSSGRNGPSLRGVFREPYLPSGIPANDERVSEIILHGKSKMPGYGQVLDRAQLEHLLLYLKTL